MQEDDFPSGEVRKEALSRVSVNVEEVLGVIRWRRRRWSQILSSTHAITVLAV